MLEKIKKMFQEKDEKKKIENLIVFLIILVVTLILVNKILKEDTVNQEESYQNDPGVQLVNKEEENTVLVNSEKKEDMENNLENILSKINGVRKSSSFNYLFRKFFYNSII